MRSSTAACVVTFTVGLAALAGLSSCQEDAQTAAPCTDIPVGGCPLSRGMACQDPSCEAVYACRPDNVWQLDHSCPPHEAGAPREASADVASEAARAFDAAIDAPPGANGGPGCVALQPPDCMVGEALACPAGCCGCDELYVCESGSWSYYATCKE